MQATNIARRMVREWGMSGDMGFIKYSDDDSQGGYQFQNEYSEETGRKLDDAVRNIIETQFDRAKTILTEHRDKLTLLSETLLKKETMSAYEVKVLLGMEVKDDDFGRLKELNKNKLSKRQFV